MNFERYLRREVLGAIGGDSLVWGLDEIDRLFTCPFGSEVFGLFRSWHNRRSLDHDGPWNRLTLAIAYATEAHLFITDLNQSPFNVGTRLNLSDFSRPQVEELNRRCTSPLKSIGDVVALLRPSSAGSLISFAVGLDEMAVQSMSDRDVRSSGKPRRGAVRRPSAPASDLVAAERIAERRDSRPPGRPALPIDRRLLPLRPPASFPGNLLRRFRFGGQIYRDYLSRNLP